LPATTEVIGSRPTPAPLRRTPEEMSSLHHCKIQENTIANKALWIIKMPAVRCKAHVAEEHRPKDAPMSSWTKILLHPINAVGEE
jgi:hypothetical protein